MLTRIPLREQIAEVVTERILAGRLGPGERLSEPGLSEDLGISRTPLREALLTLETSGLVQSDMGKGFSVGQLSADEYREICPIQAVLHAQALRMAGVPGEGVRRELRQINAKIELQHCDGKRLFDYDRKWHALLLRHCPNQRLLVLVREYDLLARRYDLAYWRDAGDANVSHEQHEAVVNALDAGKLKLATQRLEAHWLAGMEPVINWLQIDKAK